MKSNCSSLSLSLEIMSFPISASRDKRGEKFRSAIRGVKDSFSADANVTIGTIMVMAIVTDALKQR